ncbi:MAG: HAMP domain-containing sensor histidine kinase [Acidobacteriota bacterium]|nr:HAMP domain-containing sensor histidine kinase [Acidobacteriota bacterium]
MSQKYLGIAKLMLLLLAVAGPFGLYRAWHNDRKLILADENLRRNLISDNEQLLRQVTQNFFAESRLLASRALARRKPGGSIEGLPPFPGVEAFVAAGSIRLGEQTSADTRYLELLHHPGNFASGLPKRYAGLIELMRGSPAILGPADHDRFLEVAALFWEGRDLDADTHAFLLSKLPEETCAVFYEQQRFLGMSTERRPGHFLVNLHLDDTHYFLDLPPVWLDRLNQSARSFNLDIIFRHDDNWLDWGDISMTLRTEQAPLAGLLYQRGLIYGATTVVLELILLLVYQVLVTYEKINRAQKQLLAATSHELRTPLAVIRQFAEMLVDRGEQFPERTRTYHDHIHRETLKMQFLVENLLSAARFEFLKLEVNPTVFDMKAWLEETIAGVEHLGEGTRISLESPSEEVCWDRSLMSQALVNLIRNAHIHAGTDIQVRAERDGDRINIDIRDFGENPDVKYLSRIRAFTPDRKSKRGLGLGLYLTDRILKTHGGVIHFHAAEPGLRVRLSLPPAIESDKVS